MITYSKVHYGEFFTFSAEVGRREYASSAEVEKQCFGSFTKTPELNNCKIDKVTVNLYFNHFDKIPKRTVRCLNYINFESISVCKREFAYIHKHLKQYANFTYTAEFDTVDKIFHSNIFDPILFHDLGAPVSFNSVLTLHFTDCCMPQVFLVMHMYRRYLQVVTKREYWLSKKLAQERWHNLSFVNISMICDMFARIPFDQKILHGLTCSNATKFISVKSFAENVHYVKNRQLISMFHLSKVCTVGIDAMSPYTSFTIPISDGGLFQGRNLYKHESADMQKLENFYNSIQRQFQRNRTRLHN